jgi:hypothetical protein
LIGAIHSVKSHSSNTFFVKTGDRLIFSSY